VAEISFENSSLLCRNVRFAQRLFIAAETLAAGLHIERTGNDGDAAMAFLNHVAYALARAAHIIEQDSIRLDAGNGAVKTDESDPRGNRALEVRGVGAAG